MPGREGGTRPTIRIGVRRWSHLMPLLTGDVGSDDFLLRLVPLQETPSLWDTDELDGAETSFSRYALACGAGDHTLVGLPAFVMRSFRHRCLLVRQDSDLADIAQLEGCRVGLTGWPDSGNTWTRALLRRAGVGLDRVKWTLAPVAPGDVPKSHGAALPVNVDVASSGESLLSMLTQGALDAVMSPFMPAVISASDQRFRFLLSDFATVEADYFTEVGFVPGIHLVTLKREVVERHPALPAAVVTALEQSKRRWWADRRRYADGTPWMLADILRTEQEIGRNWMPYGVEANQEMIAAFCQELYQQDLIAHPIDPSDLFRDYQNLAGQTEGIL